MMHYADKKTEIIILTGKNTGLRKKIEETFGFDERIKAIPFTSHIHLYMDACDVILSKPGFKFYRNRYQKHSTYTHTTNSRMRNKKRRIFCIQKMSIHITNADIIAKLAFELIKNKKKINEMLKAQNNHINKFAAEEICDFLIKQGEEKNDYSINVFYLFRFFFRKYSV
jgi:processive 1,2-diacylglycerol beta-glucosyltransferase